MFRRAGSLAASFVVFPLRGLGHWVRKFFSRWRPPPPPPKSPLRCYFLVPDSVLENNKPYLLLHSFRPADGGELCAYPAPWAKAEPISEDEPVMPLSVYDAFILKRDGGKPLPPDDEETYEEYRASWRAAGLSEEEIEREIQQEKRNRQRVIDAYEKLMAGIPVEEVIASTVASLRAAAKASAHAPAASPSASSDHSPADPSRTPPSPPEPAPAP